MNESNEMKYLPFRKLNNVTKLSWKMCQKIENLFANEGEFLG